MKRSRLLLFALTMLATTLGVGVASQSPARAAGTIHPGVMMFTDGAQCTANFVFRGAATYLGYAAHCAGTGEATDTNGCDAGSLPLGTPVEIDGAAYPGRLAYSSWLTMQARGETDPDACAYNDFALVLIDARDVASVDPTIPRWGGPVGLATGTSAGETVYSYGNSSLRFGITQLSPKTGLSLGSTNGNWTQTVSTITPGIPGDSGSAFLNSRGQAVGVLSTLALAPLAGSNGVGGLANELAYMHANSAIQATLVPGTAPFRGGLPL